MKVVLDTNLVRLSSIPTWYSAARMRLSSSSPAGRGRNSLPPSGEGPGMRERVAEKQLTEQQISQPCAVILIAVNLHRFDHIHLAVDAAGAIRLINGIAGVFF